ncbi:ProQ/FINO family protein [Escherichia coli]
MVTLTINRKPQGIFAKPQQDQTNTAHKGRIPPQVNDRQKPANKTPWRHMTKRQRKNRKRINRLVELWPELFNRENPKPIKVGIADDLIQDITLRKQVFGTGALRAAVASYAQSTLLPCVNGRWRPLRPKGQPCGEVTPQEQKEAETRLMILNEKRKQRHGESGQKLCNE